ncbi:hypothetical protein GCM10025780_09110 [Frondihabitans cladoniiphilus]|uniref:DUF304 domain-containing protein n=1 Tax=Frondihabitans cladoniiphilus TaxID=715785 RepID=A0ABP8VRW4_9MICO
MTPEAFDDLRRSYVRYATLRQPLFWAYLVVGLVFLVLGIALPFAGAIVFGAILLVLVPLNTGLSIRRSLRSLAAGYVLGSQISSSFGFQGFTLTTPRSEVRTDYVNVGRIRVVGNWVLLRNRNIRVVSILPRAVFPDEAVARVRWAAAAR